MSCSVDGTTNAITLTKGDTFKTYVNPVDENGYFYAPKTGDVVRFALKKSYKDDTCLIKKTIPNDTLLLHLEPSDTKNLEVGPYVYDIELTYANGDVDTFIDRAKFKLTEEVD